MQYRNACLYIGVHAQVGCHTATFQLILCQIDFIILSMNVYKIYYKILLYSGQFVWTWSCISIHKGKTRLALRNEA